VCEILSHLPERTVQQRPGWIWWMIIPVWLLMVWILTQSAMTINGLAQAIHSTGMVGFIIPYLQTGHAVSLFSFVINLMGAFITGNNYVFSILTDMNMFLSVLLQYLFVQCLLICLYGGSLIFIFNKKHSLKNIVLN
jgi:hypothetical protein